MAAARSPIVAWLGRWGTILPLLAAELVLWLGFGALLPILPLYFTAQGIDLATLGIVIAAWPVARLVAEPAFGAVADRTARKPLMVGALLLSGLVAPLPLIFVGPLAFILARAISGLATAAYDPAARGLIVDATPTRRRGEAFGLYGAAQMGGLLVGPAIGAFGTSVSGSQAFVFVVSAASSLVAALVIWLTVREPVRIAGVRSHLPPGATVEVTASSPQSPGAASQAEGEQSAAPSALLSADVPESLVNRRLISAIVINSGSYFAAGVYEVTWSIFVTVYLGAGLDLVGATFAAFAVPALVLSPVAGRFVDRRGSFVFVVAGTLMIAGAGLLYTVIPAAILTIPIILFESTGFALLLPALYAVVASGSPLGRTSTAQGLFGAAGTIGFIISSLVAGRLAALDLRYPYWTFAAVMVVTLVVGLVIGGPELRSLGRRPTESG